MTVTPQTRSILFDRGPLGEGSFFYQPEQIIEAWHPEDVGDALREIEACHKRGNWLAGTASYELGYALVPKLLDKLPMGRKEPLLRFGGFEQVHVPPAPAFKGDYHLAAFKPEWDFQTYKQAFDIMRGFLQSGDIYQAKLTFPMAAAYKGCLVRLYERLKQKQPVPFGAFVDLGGAKLLCRSPELFFSL